MGGNAVDRLRAGVFASSSTWAFVVGIGGAASVASGYKFTYAAVLLSILVVTHGIGSYAAKLGGHKRHRDALMFVGAQDLSVLAALLVSEDAARRGWDDYRVPLAAASLLLPVLGPSLYLAARPRIASA